GPGLMPLLFEPGRMDSMPKKIDTHLRARCVRLVREHQQEYPTLTAATAAVARQEGVSRESVQRWPAQAEVDDGTRPSSTRIVSSFDVGSTSRASTTCSNTSSPTIPKPKRAYAARSVDQSTSLVVPTTRTPLGPAAADGLAGGRASAMSSGCRCAGRASAVSATDPTPRSRASCSPWRIP